LARLATLASDDRIAKVMGHAVKIASLEVLRGQVSQQIKQVGDMNETFGKQEQKLRKASSSNGSRTLKGFDADAFNQQIASHNALVNARLNAVAYNRSRITAFQPQPQSITVYQHDDGLFSFNNMLMWYLLFGDNSRCTNETIIQNNIEVVPNEHTALTAQMFALDQDFIGQSAQVQGLDQNVIDNITANYEESFRASLQSLDLPSINVDTPNFDSSNSDSGLSLPNFDNITDSLSSSISSTLSDIDDSNRYSPPSYDSGSSYSSSSSDSGSSYSSSSSSDSGSSWSSSDSGSSWSSDSGSSSFDSSF
jgi:hypothetical protein